MSQLSTSVSCICFLDQCVCGLTRGADVEGAHDPLDKSLVVPKRARPPPKRNDRDSPSLSEAAVALVTQAP